LAAMEGLDQVAGATIQTMDEVLTLKDESKRLGEGIAITHTMANQAMKESEACIEKVKDIAEGTKKVVHSLGRKCTSNANRVQDVQLSLAENVLIFRGIPSKVGSARESAAEMETALNEALGKIRCPKLRLSSIKRLQKSKTADSKTPRVLRVALASGLEKTKLFEAIDKFTQTNQKVPFACSHEIPRYAINSFKYCNKLASLCRVGDKDCKVRVMIPRGERWPLIFIKRANEGEFRKLNKTELQQVKAELQEREKKERAKKGTTSSSQVFSQGTRARAQERMDTTLDNLTLGK